MLPTYLHCGEGYVCMEIHASEAFAPSPNLTHCFN